MKNRIDEGDRVRILFASNEGIVEGTVDYTPQALGDSWVIVLDNGDVVYVQMFETMYLLHKPNGKDE